MRCGTLYDALVALERGSTPVDGAAVRELISRGMVRQVKATGAPDAVLKSQLEALLKEYSENSAKLGGMQVGSGLNRKEYAARSEKLAETDRKMRDIRRELLRSSAEPSPEGCAALEDGTMVQLTFQGREFMHTLGARLVTSGDKDMISFMKEMEWLRTTFSERAERAQAILKATSPRMKGYEEIHLRSAAVGLSGIADIPPKALAKEFRAHARSKSLSFMTAGRDLLGPEVLTMMKHISDGSKWSAGAFRELRTRLASARCARFSGGSSVDRAAAVIFSWQPEFWPLIISQMDAVNGRKQNMGLMALAIMAMEGVEGQDMEETLARYDFFLNLVEGANRGKDLAAHDKAAAAAFLASSPMEMTTLGNRYGAVKMILDDLFLDRMDTAAALISIMAPGVMETLDNIRLASAEIMRCKLSLGGVENFSLGLKMVLQAGARVSGSVGVAPPARGFTDFSSNTLAMSTTVRGYGVPYMVFHRSLVHSRAMHHHRHHPVHSHYVYG